MASSSRRVFRRPGTVVFGWLAGVFVLGISAWAAPSAETLSDRLIGSAIESTILFWTVFRSGVWPAVIVSEQSVVVRNPIGTVLFTGVAQLKQDNSHPQPIIVGSEGEVFAFAFSASILATIRGDRHLRALGRALDERVPHGAQASMRRERIRVFRQFVVLEIAVAGLVLVASSMWPGG